MLDSKELKVHNDKSMYFKILEFLKKSSSPNFVELLMPEYISEPNKHIEEYLDYYCNDRLNDYAVLIRGDWGAGKTWFIKEYEKKLNQDGFNRVVYISLNGVSGKDAIDDMIFCALHPVLSHKITKVIGRVAAGVIKTSTKIDINDNEATLSLSIPTVDVSSVFKDGKKLILIFDDLERCQMKISETLGYINYFVEHTESRAIILANEEKFSKCDIYKNEKEKLVGATFEFKGDIRSALNYFISELKSRSIKPKLSKEDNFESIITIYNISKFNNIRSLRQSLREFERFYHKRILKENEELFSKILILFLIFSLELRNNGFDDEVLKIRVDSGGDNLQKKYNLMGIGSFLLSGATWNNILTKNIIDDTVINGELKESYFQYLEDQPEWLMLWKYFDLTNEEFNIVVDSAISKIKKSEWKEFGEVIHVIAALIYFNKKGILTVDIEDIKKNALMNISNIYKNKDHLYVKEFKSDPFDSGWGGYSYQDQDSVEFRNFMKSLYTHIDKLDDDSVRRDAVNLLNLMAENPRLFYQRICLTNSSENYYWNIPILKEIPPEEFAKIYSKLDLDSFKVVYSALSNRYNTANTDLLQPEKNWLASVIENVKTIIDGKTGVERLKLEDYSLEQLKIIYRDKFS